MKLDKNNMKKLCGLILFAGVVILAMTRFDEICLFLQFVLSILAPFITGAAFAFVLNIPMKQIEKNMWKNKTGKWAAKLRRPVSIFLTLLSVLLVVTLVIWVVVPQLMSTVAEIANQIPAFIQYVQAELKQLFDSNPALMKEVQEISSFKFSLPDILEQVSAFLKNGAGNVVTSTLSAAGGFFGGIVNFFVSLIFALYILGQKEKLGGQFRRLFQAYLSPKANTIVLDLCSRLSKNFSSFISGQCLEAVILGSLFVIVMTILRLPYAVLVGVLIGFTALIPVVGAFIGCFVGAFLILVDNPLKALIFIIVFLILQQIEGNLIYPRVVGNSVGLPAIWVLVAVMVGGSLFGVLGMLIFIPLVSTVYGLLREDAYRRTETAEITKKDDDTETNADNN